MSLTRCSRGRVDLGRLARAIWGRASVRGCGPSNLAVDLDLLHTSMKIRSSFAECRVQIQLSAQDLPRLSPHQGEAEMGR